MPLGIDFVQVLIHMFNVIILFGGLYFLLYGPVKKFMEQREEHYKKLDDEKNSALEEARRLKEEREAQLGSLEEEISQKKQEAAKELKTLRSQKMKEAEEEASQIISKAETEAQRKRKEIVDGAKDDISSIIADAADKLLVNGDTDSFYDAFLEDAEKNAERGAENA
ncbi:MAG: ATP synthase F0 subunit B [Eubacterium sp.]|jgi:F-type H+-transporting ATPase subunit b|nr:ATP synthase F0 subunit B [Eubacterium sp.]